MNQEEEQVSSNTLRIKCVVVGDDAFEKTLLCLTFANQKYPSELEIATSKLDHFTCGFVHQDKRIELDVWNTSGQEEHPRLRPLSYCDTNVFIICYSVTNWKSFENVETTWVPELSHHQPGIPFILVALNIEQREAASGEHSFGKYNSMVSTLDGQQLSEKVGAVKFIECSCRNLQHVETVFQEAIHAAMDTMDTSNSWCLLQ